MDEIILLIFRACLNCTINFCFCLAIILIIIRFFHVRNPHMKYLLFLIPFIKLWFDSFTLIVHSNLVPVIPFNRKTLDLCFSIGLGSTGISVWPLIFSCIISHYAYSFGDIVLIIVGNKTALVSVFIWMSISLFLLTRRYITYFLFIRNMENSLVESLGHGIYLSAMKGSPMAMGILHPKIIIPIDLYKRLSNEELNIIVNHERNHIKRQDNLINHIIGITKDIFFFIIPLEYLIKKIFLEREKICDRLAIGKEIEKALQLSKAILKVAESQVNLRKDRLSGILPATSLYFAEKTELLSRITDILACPREKNGIFQSKLTYITLALIILKLLIGASFFASSGIAKTCASLAMKIIVSA